MDEMLNETVTELAELAENMNTAELTETAPEAEPVPDLPFAFTGGTWWAARIHLDAADETSTSPVRLVMRSGYVTTAAMTFPALLAALSAAFVQQGAAIVSTDGAITITRAQKDGAACWRFIAVHPG